MKIPTYTIYDKKYYMAYELIKYNIGRPFFRTCMNNPRKCIVKHNIPKHDYLFAIYKNNTYKIYDSSFKKAHLYLSSDYVNNNVLTSTMITTSESNEKKREGKPSNSFLQKCANPFSCIYLFSLGTVKDLRNDIGIEENSIFDENDIVCKFGLTNNLQRRTLEHRKTFGNIKQIRMELETCAYITPPFLYEAESKLHNHFKLCNSKLEHESFKELVVLSVREMKLVKLVYADISNLCNLSHVQLGHEIKRLQLEKELLSKEIELQNEKHSNLILKEKIENLNIINNNNK